MNSKNLVINHPVFRLIGPLVSGSIIYLLILLLYNNLEQILQTFLSKEFILCVSLAIIVSESSRAISHLFTRLSLRLGNLWSIVSIVGIACTITIIAVVLALQLYFRTILEYAPDFSEMQIFLILYLGFCIAYMSIYLSGHFVQKAQVQSLRTVEKLKSESKENFTRFTRGINTDLLFESLETIISYSHEDKDKADDLIDDLSIVYRYTLTKNQIEIIGLKEELKAVDAFIDLVNHLPYQDTKVDNKTHSELFVIPGTIIFIIEQIIRTTIVRNDQSLEIEIVETGNQIQIKYSPQDKLTESFDKVKIRDLSKSYYIFTEKEIEIENSDNLRTIKIPQINYKSEDHEDTDH